MSGSTVQAPSPFRQPRAVYAVGFACVISFMGIGLVDPILPALASRLNASPAQVELLFTSYLVVTALAMLITGWVSSRIGAKRTLIAGLALIGLNNTLVTTAVMSISRVPRGVASATYGFVRFVGGGLAPYAAGKMVEAFNVHVPFLVGTCTVLAGAALLATVRPALDAADAAETGADVEAGADGQPGPVPVAGPARMGQAGQSATVTSIPLTVTTAAGVDASRHRV
jgi:MFS family permease